MSEWMVYTAIVVVLAMCGAAWWVRRKEQQNPRDGGTYQGRGPS